MKITGTYAKINLDNIVHNYKEACRHTGAGVIVSCVVKSDAYGHGEKQVTETLIENGLSLVCVGTIREGLRIRANFPELDILILGYTPQSLAGKIVENNLIQSVGTLKEAMALGVVGPVRVHVKVNTGMNRLGFPVENIDEIISLYNLDNIDICGIFSHLHSSDSVMPAPNLEQFEKFEHLLKKLDENGLDAGIRHLCNSGGIISYENMHLDMVREGIMLYGLYPSDSVSRDMVNLKECMELHSYVSQVIDVKKGEGISYGHTFIAPYDMKIATVSLGYSDGVFRHISNKGEIIIHDERRRIVGTVCMNLIMVDVTGMDSIQAGDDVILFGRSNNQFISIDEVAAWAGTISYDVVCRTGYCVPRVYQKNGNIIETEEVTFTENNESIFF